MALIADSNPEHMRTYRPRRRSATWRFVKRNGLIELLVILGGICLAWLGVAFGSGQLYAAAATRTRFSNLSASATLPPDGLDPR